MGKGFIKYCALIGVNLIYASTAICTKLASGHSFMSWQYLLWLCAAVGVMGIYAICWQQIIRRMDISTAYMFKGTALIFTLLYSAILFGETISWHNIIGAIIIVWGIVLFAKSDAGQR